MKKNKFPAGWDEERVRRVLDHYENQTDSQAVAEDEAAFSEGATVMRVPKSLVSAVRAMIAAQSTSRNKKEAVRVRRSA